MVLDRDQILGNICREFEGAQGRGVAYLLSGAAGMGKTHLARQFLRRLPDGAAALVGTVPPTGTPPLLPICRALASDTGDAVTGEVREGVATLSLGAPIVRETLGPMLEGCGASPGPISTDIVPPETHTFFVLSEILRRVAARRRTVLFIDDVQWLDASSASFLSFLADNLSRVPVFMLLSARTNGSVPPLLSDLRLSLARSAENHFVDCKLPALSNDEITAVAEAYLGGPARCTAEEVDWLRRSSKGIPNFLREVVLGLRNDGTLQLLDGAWRLVRPLESLMLPASLRDMTLARIASVTSSHPSIEALVQYGAVYGRQFDAHLLGRAVGLSTRDTMALLERVAGATGLVTRIGKTTQWEFDHDLTREAILDHLGDLARDLHYELAELLSKDGKSPAIEVAHHYEAARAFRPAAASYGQAARSATEHFAFEDAVAAARRRDAMLAADGCLPDSTERIAAAKELAPLLVSAQRYPEAVEHIERLVEMGGGDAQVLHALGRAKLTLPDRDSHEEAVSVLRAALALPETSSDPRIAFELWTELVFAYHALGNQQGARAAFRRASAAARESGDARLQLRVMRLTCIFWQPDKVVEVTKQALDLARSGRHRFEEALCLNNLGTQYFYLHDIEAAQGHFAKSDAILRSYGGFRRDIPLNNLGLTMMVTGQHEKAAALLREAREASLEPDDRMFIRTNEAVVRAMSGDVGHAAEALSDLATEAEAAGDVFHMDCIQHNLARALLLLGRPAEAAEAATRCPPRSWLTDDALIAGKRAGLLLEVAARLGRPPSPELEEQHRVVHQTTKPQAWLYRLPWELCDIQFWQE